MITIYIVRHGTTEANEKGIIQGQLDTPLTEEGKRDAALLAEKFKNVELDHIYASDLGRAFITEFIIAQLDHEVEKIRETKALREVNYGIYQDRIKKEVLKEVPHFGRDMSLVFPNGESILQAQERVLNFFLGLEHEHLDKTILCVTHSGIIRALKSHFTGESLEELWKKPVPHEYIGKYVLDEGELISYEEL